LTTKIHAAVDELGNPVRLLLTGGETADITQAQALIDGFGALSIVADKGYDSNAFVLSITSRNAEAVIPSRKNRIIGREYDQHFIKIATLLNDFSIVSNSSGDWRRAMRNSRGALWRCCISSLPLSGCNN